MNYSELLSPGLVRVLGGCFGSYGEESLLEKGGETSENERETEVVADFKESRFSICCFFYHFVLVNTILRRRG